MWITEGIELFKKHVSDAGLLVELTSGSGLERLTITDEPSRQRPTPFIRRQGAFYEKNVQARFTQGEDYEIDGYLDISPLSHDLDSGGNQTGALGRLAHPADCAGIELEKVRLDAVRKDDAARRHQ